MLWMIGLVLDKLSNLGKRCRMKYVLHSFGSHGERCQIEDGVFTAKNIYCGHDVYVGAGATFLSADAKIVIGNYVMFGPNVSIVTGNHRTDVIGRYMIDIKEKRPTDDEDVVIEDDVWVGMGVTILKGVTIGKGSVIGANTLVTKDVPPYSVVYGKQETVVKRRFTDEQIAEHEAQLADGT